MARYDITKLNVAIDRGNALAHLIKPLPSFDEVVLGATRKSA